MTQICEDMQHLVPLWGELQISRITTKMIEEYKGKRIEHVVASTVTRELFTLKNMLKNAVEWGYLKESAAAPVKKLKSGTPHFRYLSKGKSKPCWSPAASPTIPISIPLCLRL